jgi:hypothetical protein
MPKLPDDADMNRIYALPLNQRVPALIISVIELNRHDSIAIIKTFLAITEAIAQAQGMPTRLAIADLLDASADTISRPEPVKCVGDVASKR